MEELYVIELDCSTGEQVTRKMTDEEVAAHLASAAESEARRIAKEEAKATLEALKASARAKLVSGTPLTPEEAATLVI